MRAETAHQPAKPAQEAITRMRAQSRDRNACPATVAGALDLSLASACGRNRLAEFAVGFNISSDEPLFPHAEDDPPVDQARDKNMSAALKISAKHDRSPVPVAHFPVRCLS